LSAPARCTWRALRLLATCQAAAIEAFAFPDGLGILPRCRGVAGHLFDEMLHRGISRWQGATFLWRPSHVLVRPLSRALGKMSSLRLQENVAFDEDDTVGSAARMALLLPLLTGWAKQGGRSHLAPSRTRVLDLDVMSAVQRSPVLQLCAASGVLVECKGSDASKDHLLSRDRVL